MSPSRIIAIDFFSWNVEMLPDGVLEVGVWVQMQFIACWLKISENLHHLCACVIYKADFNPKLVLI